ncbi:MAG TPA: metallophosphoesterase [Limnochordales bacterium]
MLLWLLAAAAAGAAYLAVRSWAEAHSLFITQVDVPIEGLPPELDGFTILHLSDLHLRGYGPFEQDLVRTVRTLPAPVLVITGDFLGEPGAASALIPLLMEIGRDRLVYGVLGNNDRGRRLDTQALARDLTRAGVRLLVNGGEVIRHRGRRIRIAGVDDPHTGLDDVDQALACVPPSQGDGREPLVLLAHSPDVLEAASRAGVDLVLAGHTHGGQICLPGGVPLWTNTRRGRFSAGLYRHGRTQMFVTRGIGTSALPGRLFCPPEVAVVRLVPASSESSHA